MMRIVVSLMVLLLAACTPSVDSRPLDELMTSESEVQYRAKIGDTLDVQVWGEPKLSGEVFVREDGQFSMPLINDVAVAGKTLNEIKTLVTAKLRTFVPGASVTVNLTQSAPIRYYLLGNFLKPGEYHSEGMITFLQAVASGGGFGPFANESSLTLIRKTSEGELRYELDYNRVVAGKEPNPKLKEGDVIAVR